MLSYDSLVKKLDFKVSTKQSLVIKALFLTQNPISAKGLKKLVKINFNTDVSLPTMYKILQTLENLQMLYILHIKHKKTKYYQLKSTKSYSHLVCEVCQKFTSFLDKDLNEELKLSLCKENFILLNHRILLYGVCKECNG